MAYDKIITIRARLDDCLRYIQDGDKTALSLALDYIEDSGKTTLGNEVILQSAINCTLETCYLDMQRTKERFGKPGGVVGYHLVHSYVPGETTPELAHEAGVEFARRLLGDKYEAVICTHMSSLQSRTLRPIRFQRTAITCITVTSRSANGIMLSVSWTAQRIH